MSKRILYLSDYELRALEIKGKRLKEIQRFQIGKNGQTLFAHYLRDDIKTPILLLVDATQEGNQIEYMPHVLGSDHRNLVARRIKQLFENTDYTHSVVQGRETQGRRDDRVLFMGLNNPTILQPWLDMIQTHKVPLAGIYSVPLLTQLLLKWMPKAHNLLLVAQTPPITSHSTAGLRQSFFVNAKLHFTRLIPLDTDDPETYADYVFKQLIATQRYLENERLLVPIEPLSVVILTDTPLLNVIKTKASDYDTSTINLQFVDSNELAHKMAIRTNEESLYLYHFVAVSLARQWIIKNHYAKSIDTRYFLYRKIRFALYLTSLLILSGTAWASWMIFEETKTIQETGLQIQERIVQRHKDIKQLRAQVPPGFPPNIELVRNVVDVGLHLKAHQAISPQSLFLKLSQILNQQSEKIFLERLEWGIGPSKAEIFPANPKKERRTDNEESHSSSKNKAPASGKNFIEGLRLHGRIHPFDGDYQQALRLFQRFERALRQQRIDWKIDVIRSPSIPKILGGKKSATIDNTAFIIDILIKHNYPHKPL
jgi:hypothetical protein